jgi:hypothetical protein
MRGGMADVDTMRSGAPRRLASRAAHSTASTDSREPSVATTIEFAAITSSLPRYGAVRPVPDATAS